MGGKPRFGSFLVMNPSSMIVFQIDVDGIAFDPAKCNAPVSAGAEPGPCLRQGSVYCYMSGN
jgi:hypothetical protein